MNLSSSRDTDRHWLLSVRLPHAGGRFDVAVEGGTVVDIVESAANVQTQNASQQSENLDGFLLLPSLQEHHAHLDKALTADVIVNRHGDLAGAIDAWLVAEREGRIGLEEMQQRAERMLRELVLSGVGKVRTHVNVGGTDPDLRNLRAVDAARHAYRDIIDVDIVALLHSPLTGPAGHDNRLALDRALEFGIDAIGGCPHLEADAPAMIAHVLEVARSAQLPLDLHMDETLDPTMVTVELLARAVIDASFDQEVTASHCVSLSVQARSEQIRLAQLLHQARIRVVALPQTNLYLQGRTMEESMPRGIAPLRLLSDHGVEIAAGGDNVQDPFNPMGRGDPLETASLLVLASHLDAMDALAAVSCAPAGLVDVTKSWLGTSADFVAVEADNVRSALAIGTMSRRTIRRGRIVARSRVERELAHPR